MGNIKQIGNTLHVEWNKFDIEGYMLFLQSKGLPEYNLKYYEDNDTYKLTCPSRFAHIFGIEERQNIRQWLPKNKFLFDYQDYIIYQFALPLKRYAIWADTGLGKTIMMLELARQVAHKTGGRVLLISPLNILPQTLDEKQKFYGDEFEIEMIQDRKSLKWFAKSEGQGIGIVNPEKFIPRKGDAETISECQFLSGCLLDEASILKGGGGTIKWALIKSCRGIEYKYTFTATPAPNDVMEYASQGSFLEKLRNEGEILWTFYTRTKDGKFKIKDHAKSAFYRFMAGWSIYLRNPKRYGFKDILKDIPDPITKEYIIPITDEQKKMVMDKPDKTGQLAMFPTSDEKLEMIDRIKYSEIAKGFIYEGKNGNRKSIPVPSLKPQFVADLIMIDLKEGRQVLTWTIFDEESKIIFDLIDQKGFTIKVLTGKVPKAKRMPIIEDFRIGKIDCLITKASLLGYGLNFQNCTSNVISGFNDSEEQRYQLERRTMRYGQIKAVKFHYPYIKELEGVVYDNINQKRERIQAEVRIMENYYIKAMEELSNGR